MQIALQQKLKESVFILKLNLLAKRLFLAFTSSPNFGDMAEEANEEASEEARLQMAMNLMARL